MKIGILGGIGPEATAYFYAQLISKLQHTGTIRKNTDFPQIIINSIPAPELHLEEHDKAEIVEPYIEGVRELVTQNVDFIVMVCNTIHLYLADIEGTLNIDNILSIRDIAKTKLDKTNSQRICVMGTGLTVSKGLYKFDDYEYVDLNDAEQRELCAVVVDFNNGGERAHNRSRLLKLMQQKAAEGAERFILACTEISELVGQSSTFAVTDTLELLIDATVQKVLDEK